MEYIYVGKYTNTHGLKGEIRIVSTVPYKKDIFKVGTKLYFGKEKEMMIIASYRPHKAYDMVVLKGKTTIEDMLPYKGMDVWVKKSEVKSTQYFYEDLIGLNVIVSGKQKGVIFNILQSKAHDIFVIKTDDKNCMIPYVDTFIDRVDLEQKKIYFKDVEGFFHVED